jgi:plasmid stabilization system protein ParE
VGIRVAPQARAYLDAIWLYIAQESASPSIATRTIASITDKFGLFARFPHIGKSLESHLRPNIRTFPVNNHIISHNVRVGEVRILRIIHTSRDAHAIFLLE